MELLIKRAQQGDKDAFTDVIQECLPQLYKVAHSRIRSEECIGDAIQETIFSAYRNLHQLKEVKYFKTWLIKILINECNKITKRDSYITYVEDCENVSYQVPYISDYEQVENNIVFESMLNSLKENYRTVVVLYYVNDFSTKEISNILEIQETTVKVRLNRARKQLKKHYCKDNKSNENIGGVFTCETILMKK